MYYIGNMPDEGASSSRVGNYLTDGRLDYWSADSQSSSGYDSAIMWYNYQFAGTGTYIRKVPLAINEIPEVPTAEFCMQIDPSGSYAVVSQRIEQVRTLAGNNATLSFWAKANATGAPIEASVVQHYTDDPDLPSSITTLGSPITVSTTMERYTVDFSIPQLPEYTAGNNGYLEVNLKFTGSNVFHIACIQLQSGNTADYFEELTPQDALFRLNRYYYTSAIAGPYSYGAYNSGQVQTFIFPLPTAMRVLPTVTLSGVSVSNGSASAVASTTNSILINVTSSGITPPPPTTPPADSPPFPSPTTVSVTFTNITADARL